MLSCRYQYHVLKDTFQIDTTEISDLSSAIVAVFYIAHCQEIKWFG